MITNDYLTRKARWILGITEKQARLTVDGQDYYGMIESNSYATKYRDNGWLDGTSVTWVGVHSLIKFAPLSGTEVLLDDKKLKILGSQLDPVGNIIRIDLGDFVTG